MVTIKLRLAFRVKPINLAFDFALDSNFPFWLLNYFTTVIDNTTGIVDIVITHAI